MIFLAIIFGALFGSVTTWLVMRRQANKLRGHKLALYSQLLQIQNGYSLMQEAVAANMDKDELPRGQVQ